MTGSILYMISVLINAVQVRFGAKLIINVFNALFGRRIFRMYVLIGVQRVCRIIDIARIMK